MVWDGEYVYISSKDSDDDDDNDDDRMMERSYSTNQNSGKVVERVEIEAGVEAIGKRKMPSGIVK